jgi:hypothetical protein
MIESRHSTLKFLGGQLAFFLFQYLRPSFRLGETLFLRRRPSIGRLTCKSCQLRSRQAIDYRRTRFHPFGPMCGCGNNRSRSDFLVEVAASIPHLTFPSDRVGGGSKLALKQLPSGHFPTQKGSRVHVQHGRGAAIQFDPVAGLGCEPAENPTWCIRPSSAGLDSTSGWPSHRREKPAI